MHLAGIEPLREQHIRGALDLSATKIDMNLKRSLGYKPLQKIMIFRWSSRPRMQENAIIISTSLFYISNIVEARRILPNPTLSKLLGKLRQKFLQQINCFQNLGFWLLDFIVPNQFVYGSKCEINDLGTIFFSGFELKLYIVDFLHVFY